MLTRLFWESRQFFGIVYNILVMIDSRCGVEVNCCSEQNKSQYLLWFLRQNAINTRRERYRWPFHEGRPITASSIRIEGIKGGRQTMFFYSATIKKLLAGAASAWNKR
jgi:hypothetical protein